MCRRYFISAAMAGEVETIVQDTDPGIRKGDLSGDIRPTDLAPVIEKTEAGLRLALCRWGYPLVKGKELVVNARVESVLEKPSFRNGIRYHRLVIPASGFYEWNPLKEKSTFTGQDAPVLYMAGFCDWVGNERRFVILTTAANASVARIHDRMPLILRKEQLAEWFDDRKMRTILRQVPGALNREAEYEQQSLF